MKDLCIGNPEVVARWHKICDDSAKEKTAWIRHLRELGFKAAHPNDGWVDRDKNTVLFAYPQFNDGAEVGDKVMLGWPSDDNEKLRPVRLTGKIIGMFTERFAFADLE